MKSFLVKPTSCIKGKFALPGDKSIAHRSLIISSLAKGKTKIINLPANQDCLYTIKTLRSLGVRIKYSRRKKSSIDVIVYGRGCFGFKKPRKTLFVGESGTTLRLILGVLAGQSFNTKLKAGRSLSQRPMLRVTYPLRLMGAQIKAKTGKTDLSNKEEFAPIEVWPGRLKAITYRLPVASAQVKSAILLAGLFAQGETRVIEPAMTRDHTELMLKEFKADIKVKGNTIVMAGGQELTSPGRIYIPGDISSAAFFIVLAAILGNSRLKIEKVGLNPSRIGLIRVLKRMGGKIKVCYKNSKHSAGGEAMGEITVTNSPLRGTVVQRKEVPTLIDELPVLMVAACFAKGISVFKGIGELRVKETDRIRSMCENLSKMGAEIKVTPAKNIVIKGGRGLLGGRLRSFGDHRTAMSLIIAGFKTRGKTYIDNVSCIKKSFPEFLSVLASLQH